MKASGMLYKAVDVDPKPKLLQEVSRRKELRKLGCNRPYGSSTSISKSLQAQGFDSRRVICTYSCLRTRTHIALYVHINVYVHVRMCVYIYICIHYNFCFAGKNRSENSETSA